MSGTAVWRVRGRKSFAAFRSANRVANGVVGVRWVPDGSDLPPKVAFAVGRRVGGAVTRNKVRRRLRAILADCAPSLPSGSYLVTAGEGAAGLSYEGLKRALGEALRKVAGEQMVRRQ